MERGGPDQVLRYYRTPAQSNISADNAKAGEEESAAQPSAQVQSSGGGRSSRGLLLLSSDAELLRQRTERLKAHPCARCGAPRTFECQVKHMYFCKDNEIL